MGSQVGDGSVGSRLAPQRRRGKEVELKTTTKLRAAGVLAAGIALSVLGLGGIASSTAAPRLGDEADATIRIVMGSGHTPKFKGPESVDRGDSLRIINKTDPQEIGPHTFSLVRHNTYPSRSEYRDCEQLEPGTICNEIAEWHDIFGQTPIPSVDVKHPGWDKMGDFQETGDSWLTESEDESETRQVAHGHKGKLVFICAVHPFMKGQIDVNQQPPVAK